MIEQVLKLSARAPALPELLMGIYSRLKGPRLIGVIAFAACNFFPVEAEEQNGGRTSIGGQEPSTCSENAHERPWTPEDSVETTYYSDSPDFTFSWSRGNKGDAFWAPGRRYCFVISHRGVMATDANRFTLHVFSIAEIDRALKLRLPEAPRPLAEIEYDSQSSTNPALEKVAWMRDGKTIVYYAAIAEKWQWFAFDCETRRVRAITNGTDHLQSSQRDGGILLWVSSVIDRVMYPAVEIPRSSLGTPAITFPMSVMPDRRYRLAVATLHGSERRIDGNFNVTRSTIAPGGRYAIVQETASGGRQFLGLDLSSGDRLKWPRILVGEAVIAPQGDPISLWEGRAMWLPDAAFVLLVNVGLPEPSGATTGMNVPNCLALVNVETGALTRIADLRKIALDANAQSQDVVFADSACTRVQVINKGASGTKTYEFVLDDVLKLNARKTSIKDSEQVLAAEAPTSVSVVVTQGANSPPKVIASDGKTELVLVQPHASSSGTHWNEFAKYSWEDPLSGRAIGRLLLPSTKGPFPLVIQLASEGWYDSFLPDGESSSGYAAQALAAKGVAVLDIPRAPAGTANEGPDIVRRLDAVVAQMSSSGLIDGNRIGIVGFSRNGFQVHYLITHPGRTDFRAAACVDSFDGTYSAYLYGATHSLNHEGLGQFEKMPGGSFWERREQWLAHEISFNVDRVRTPVLFTLHEARDFQSIPVIGAYRANDLPFEYIFFPDGSHALNRPQQRIVEMNAIVDWMEYWLTNVTPSDPSRAARWSFLRKLQEKRLKTTPPPRGKWVFLPDAEQPFWMPPVGTGPKPAGQHEQSRPEPVTTHPR